jgi:DNA-binding transcriptional LysR family regulator
MILRCTQRVLKGIGLPIVADPPAQEAALGEWYANSLALPFSGRWLVLYTSASTLLTVTAPGRAIRPTLPVFRERLPRLLRRLGLPDAWVDAQVRAARDVTVARTKDRRVIGTMNEIADLVWFMAEEHHSFHTLDLDRVELKLARVPHGMLRYRFPIHVAEALALPA